MSPGVPDPQRPTPVTKTPARPDDETPSLDELDALLDEAIEESFPASDPPAVGGDRFKHRETTQRER